jgi:hypothetical protein
MISKCITATNDMDLSENSGIVHFINIIIVTIYIQYRDSP